MIPIELDLPLRLLPRLRAVPVADRLQHQLPQRNLRKRLPQHVEHPIPQRVPLLLQLQQQPLEHRPLARLPRHQIPQVAHLPLPEAVNSPEPLLDPIRIPRQVVIDHQVRPLQVHALPRRIRRHQHDRPRIVHERMLRRPPRPAIQSAVNLHHRLGVIVAAPPAPTAGLAELRADPLHQVAERVAVLGENHQLPPRAPLVEHLRAVQHLRKLAPLAVVARAPHRPRLPLQPPQLLHLPLKLLNRARRARQIQQLRNLLLRPLLQIVQQIAVRPPAQVVERQPQLQRLLEFAVAADLAQFLQMLLQPIQSPLERLVNRRRRRRQPPLQHRQREAHRRLPPPLLLRQQLVRAVHLLLHVARHRVVQRPLVRRQLI